MRPALLACMLFASPVLAEVRLPAILSSRMVVQQQTRTAIWGWADPGEEVEVSASWGGDPARATAAADGTWKVSLQTPAAGGPFSIRVKGKNTIELTDVLAGEVWVCSGQSNMEWGLNASDRPAEEIAAANFPQIRIFDVPNEIALEPRADVKAGWQACSPQTVPGFSAVGYHFGRDLHERLKVPVGLIGANWGGTRVEAWMPREALAATPLGAPFVAEVDTARSGGDEESLARRREEWNQAHEGPGGFLGTAPNGGGWKRAEPSLSFTANGMADHDGTAWYATTVDVPDGAEKFIARVKFGPIDDMDEVWINGRRVGATLEANKWAAARNYKAEPGVFKPGYNSLVVRVFDGAGDGGLMGAPGTNLIEFDPAANVPPVVLNGVWFVQKGIRFGPGHPQPPMRQDAHANTPTVLYNGLIHPLLNHAIRGAIWYQGESNIGNAWAYQQLFPGMIASWRRLWGLGDFPFLFVQIAPYRYNSNGLSAELREAQRLTLAKSPNTGMAVIWDIGNVKDIHPRNKRDVGLRLARWARAGTYGESGVVVSGPLLAGQTVEGASIRVTFAHARGLTARGGAPTEFQIAGEDRVFKPADARIDGESVLVSSPGVPEPKAVRFGWSDTSEPNLFNGEGLPASPFRTDDWPLLTQPK